MIPNNMPPRKEVKTEAGTVWKAYSLNDEFVRNKNQTVENRITARLRAM